MILAILHCQIMSENEPYKPDAVASYFRSLSQLPDDEFIAAIRALFDVPEEGLPLPPNLEASRAKALAAFREAVRAEEDELNS